MSQKSKSIDEIDASEGVNRDLIKLLKLFKDEVIDEISVKFDIFIESVMESDNNGSSKTNEENDDFDLRSVAMSFNSGRVNAGNYKNKK